MANELCHQTSHNDIVVLATDGVLDNLFPDQIKECIKPKGNNFDMTEQGLKEAADCIATYADFLSYQKKWHSPWTVNSLAAGRPLKKAIGGKTDDITVIVSQVKLH